MDDEEDIEDEETALANFTTSIDNDETDEYIAFRTSLQGMTVGNDFSVLVFHKSSLSIKASSLCYSFLLTSFAHWNKDVTVLSYSRKSFSLSLSRVLLN